MIKVHAHRGFSDLYPENTLLAYRKAYEAGADGIEIDVRVTGDGGFICSHDNSIARTTNQTGYIDSMNLADLISLDAGGWFGEEFKGREDCRIPSLEQVLDDFNGKDITLVLDIKSSDVEKAKEIADIVDSKGMMEQCHFFSNPNVINAVKSHKPYATTYNSGMANLNTYQSILINAVENDHDAVSIDARLNLTDLQTMANDIKAEGKLVHGSYLSGNYGAGMERHLAAGTDFILGNDPEVMLSYVPNPNQPNKLIHASEYIRERNKKIRVDSFVIKDGSKLKVNGYLVNY